MNVWVALAIASILSSGLFGILNAFVSMAFTVVILCDLGLVEW